MKLDPGIKIPWLIQNCCKYFILLAAVQFQYFTQIEANDKLHIQMSVMDTSNIGRRWKI